MAHASNGCRIGTEFLLLVPSQIVQRDPEEMVLFSGDACPECGRLTDVTTPAAIVLKAPPPAGLSRTDVEFGPYWIKTPRICIDLELAERLVAQNVRGLRLLPIYVERLKLRP